MSLSTILLCVGIGAFVLFFVEYLVQVRRIRRGRRSVGRGRVIINWLLIICIIGGFGGYFYFQHHPRQVAATKQTVKTPTHDAYLYIRYDKDQAKLNQNGEAPMKIVVSPNTKVKIYGHNTHTLFKTFKVKDPYEPATLHYTFTQDAKYDIVATRGKKRLVKTIKIRGNKESSSSSATSQSPAISSSSSQANSTNNNAASTNNRTRSNSTGSSYTGGYSNYRGGASTGRGGNYTPSTNPSTPSTPSTPTESDNGTGELQ